MACKTKASIVDMSKAAAMSCHTSASFLMGVKASKAKAGISGETLVSAARLLRQAESLCRQATSLLFVDPQKQPKKELDSTKSPAAVEAAAGTLGGSAKSNNRKQRQKQRKKQKKQMEVDAGNGGAGVGSQQSPSGMDSTLQVLADVQQQLAANFGSSSSSAVKFPVGTQVVTHSLQAKDMNNLPGVVLTNDTKKDDGRIAVQLLRGGPPIRCQGKNLMTSVLPPVIQRLPDDDMFGDMDLDR